jgi:transcriptional/translational regulatory protein YebC/TACO1
VSTTFEFGEAAGNTLSFMSAMYHGMGKGGVELIEATFDNIRREPASLLKAAND